MDATAFVVDLAGSKGTVILSAEAQINLKLTAARFEGTLSVAQRTCPCACSSGISNFQTPFQASVNRPQDFVCRTRLLPEGETGKEASSTPIKRHIKVKAEVNPYDPAYETYFEKREADHMQPPSDNQLAIAKWLPRPTMNTARTSRTIPAYMSRRISALA